MQIFNQIFKTSTNLNSGFELLQAVKELGLHPSRTCLDFLLSACVKAENSQMAWLVWSEYEIAGLAYNALTFIRYDFACYNKYNFPSYVTGIFTAVLSFNI